LFAYLLIIEHLIVVKVAIGKLPILNVFGNDYKTHDGTGVRDFIHVVDLAKGHTAALKKIESMKGCQVCCLLLWPKFAGCRLFSLSKLCLFASGIQLGYWKRLFRIGSREIFGKSVRPGNSFQICSAEARYVDVQVLLRYMS